MVSCVGVPVAFVQWQKGVPSLFVLWWRGGGMRWWDVGEGGKRWTGVEKYDNELATPALHNNGDEGERALEGVMCRTVPVYVEVCVFVKKGKEGKVKYARSFG